MTEARFLKKYFWNVLCLVSGLILIGLFIFIGFADEEATPSNIMSGILFGAIILVFSTISLFFNFKAYLYIKDDRIKGKYHWFARIDCHVSDVAFAWAGINTLTIQLNKGKCHTIMGVENSHMLCAAIRSVMPFSISESAESLIEKLDETKTEKKKGLIYVCIGVVLMFVNIFATVFLTGEREMHDFSKTDWMIFSIMGALELATVIYTFYFARLTGKYNIPIEKLRYTIRRTVIETAPVYYENVIKVLTDTDRALRIIIKKSSFDEGICYVLEEFNDKWALEKQYVSDSFDSIDEMPEEFEFLTDITDKVLH